MFWSALNAAWSVFEASKTLDGSKLLSVCICFVNFYDVGDELLLRWEGSEWHWICVVVCEQNVDIGWVKVVSSVHLLC